MTTRIQWLLGCALAMALLCIDIRAGGIGSDSPADIAISSAQAQTEKRGQDSGKKSRKKRNVSRCVEYSQEIAEDAMALLLTNECQRPLQCTMTWALACHRSNGKRERKNHTETFYLGDDTGHTVTASAAQCGDDGWSIGNVRWTCRDA